MEKLRELCGQINIDISDEQLGMFNTYYEMLIETNKVMNLTAITEKDEVIVKHFVDSIVLIPFLKEKYGDNLSDLSLIDIGTGAGFPGIPIKIMLPDIKVTLLDSLNKRIKFLDSVIDTLSLKNIKTIHGRAEDYASDKVYRETFDLCVSRAVANLSTLSEYCLPFVSVNGMFISYKAGNLEEEINSSKKAIKVLGGKISKVEEFILPSTDNERVFVFINKIEKTPKTYPRKAGVPSKNPIS